MSLTSVDTGRAPRFPDPQAPSRAPSLPEPVSPDFPVPVAVLVQDRE